MSSETELTLLPSDAVAGTAPEVSVLLPCLNEALTLGRCIDRARQALREHGIRGEIVVADNGSTDGSAAIALGRGARVVRVPEKGYGNALRGGIAAARGKYIIIGDADENHDFRQIPLFLEKLREGFDLVIGNRFKGGIEAGAMRPLHRYLGSPALNGIGRLFFHSPWGDQLCGFRGVSAAAAARMGLQATGMEFASEMAIRAVQLGMRVTEVPVTHLPDGRNRRPHLRTWRDGWRHLRLILLLSPRWLFLYPGALLMAAGLLVGLWLLPGPRTVRGVTFDIHTLLYAATAILLGFQAVAFAVFAKVAAVDAGLLRRDPRLEDWLQRARLEVGLAAGTGLMLAGFTASVYAVSFWGAKHFGELNPSRTMRVIIPAALALTLGGQTVLSSFFLSILLMRRRE